MIKKGHLIPSEVGPTVACRYRSERIPSISLVHRNNLKDVAERSPGIDPRQSSIGLGRQDAPILADGIHSSWREQGERITRAMDVILNLYVITNKSGQDIPTDQSLCDQVSASRIFRAGKPEDLTSDHGPKDLYGSTLSAAALSQPVCVLDYAVDQRIWRTLSEH